MNKLVAFALLFVASCSGGVNRKSGATTAPPDPVFGLTCYGAQHINHGGFWAPDVELGNQMLWETWQSDANAENLGYTVADGYGGAHALLWGPLGGNIWNGSSTVSFSIDGEGVPFGQIYHKSVNLGTDHVGTDVITLHMNGIPVAYTPMVGTRTSQVAGAGAGTLFVCGSDHSMWSGTIYQLRAYDRFNPMGTNYAQTAYTPERSFIDGGNIPATTPPYYSDLLVDYTVPGRIINDLSQGYNGGVDGAPRTPHSGALFNPSGDYDYGRVKPQTGYELPTWESTTNHPFGTVSPPPDPLPARSLSPDSPPSGAIVFDSFSREDQTLAWQQAPTLGATESGSAGIKTWQTGLTGDDISVVGFQWALFNGKVRFLDGYYPRSIAWVDAGISDQKVCVTRKVSPFTHGTVTVASRVVDSNNFLVGSFGWNEVQNGAFAISKYVAGTFTNLYFSGFSHTKGTWTQLCLSSNGSSVSLYADAALIQTVTETDMQTATGAGIAMIGTATGPGENGFGLANWDNFTVFESTSPPPPVDGGTCQCSGTGLDGPVTVDCGQSACGNDSRLYLCTDLGWSGPGSSCSGDGGVCQCSGTGLHGPVTINCDESTCGSDSHLWTCTSSGWTGPGGSCS